MTRDPRRGEPTPWTPFDVWTTLYEDNVRRADVLLDEMSRRSGIALDQTGSAVTEVAKLGKDTASVARQLTDEWFNVVRSTTDFWGDLLGRGRSS